MRGSRVAMKLWNVFAVSVWALVALTVWDAIDNLRHAEMILSAPLAGRNFRYLLQPFVLLLFVLFVWFRFQVPKQEPGRIMAGIIGAYVLLFIVMVPLLVVDITTEPANNVGIHGFRGGSVATVLYISIGIVHLAYAFFGPRKA